MAARPKLLLIDGYHTFFRAFYAIRELANSKGLPTNAVYGFIQILRKVLKDETPDLVGVALDVSDDTVRREKYAEYKANRAPVPEDLRAQIPFLRRAIEGFRIPILELDPYEADDVMGTLSKRAAEAGYDVVLVSADKDLLQLVGPHVTMFHTGRNKRYDPALVEADYGLPPERFADYLALVGDAVDNVPGVPGIGDKGAQKLVAEYGSVEALLERADEISRKAYREGLQNHREQAMLSKELVTIHTDLPVELEPESLRLDPPDAESLRALYTELEFRGLLEELGASAEVAGAAGATREIVEPGAVAEVVGALAGKVHVALAGADPPVALALAGEDDDETCWLDLRREGLAAAAGAALATRVAEPETALAGHDLKEVLRLVPGGERARCDLRDLQLASYLLRSSAHGHSLEEIAAERLAAQPRGAREAGFDKGQEPALGDARVGAWACERLALARRLDGPLFDELATTGRLAEVYREIEAPLVPVLVGMEEAGIALDVPFLEAMSAEMASELSVLETEIHAEAGETFNLNSPQQLGAILFEKLGLPVLKKTRKTKSWSTDAATLEELARRGHELPQKLLRYREVSKLKSTYVDALPQLVAADGRVHTRFQQAVAATGRLSSVNPNLQNIPVRTEQGQRIRKAFVAAPGRLLLVADYSQIELRILAHIAAEPAMIEAFRTGQDIHRTTAASVLGVSPDLVSGEQRRAAKTINFGLIYGMSAFGLGQALGVPTSEAEAFMKAYFARYGGVQAYMQETLAAAERDGRVETLWGRVRHLPELASSNWNLRENARRVAINARIQGTAADVLKLAMIAVDARLRREHPEARLLLTVHDELVLEVPAEEVEAISRLVREEMEGVADLDVPLVAEAGWGATWYEAKG
ncbi:MAG: DNA polymerase I [Holophagales bacterium]|nr:DNA polymerase I [Holophagales bacterium]